MIKNGRGCAWGAFVALAIGQAANNREQRDGLADFQEEANHACEEMRIIMAVWMKGGDN